MSSVNAMPRSSATKIRSPEMVSAPGVPLTHPTPHWSVNLARQQGIPVIGDIELLDQGELDHKIIVIDAADPLAARINSAADLAVAMPGVKEKLVEWLKMYKTTDGKAVNALSSDEILPVSKATSVISECHASWQALRANGPGTTGFWLK